MFDLQIYAGNVTGDQCCGAGAGGAEIILEPEAGAENKF